VPVEVELACRGRRAARVEQPLGRRDRQPLGHQLCPRHRHGHLGYRVGIVLSLGVDKAVDRIGCGQHHGFGGRGGRGDLADRLQHKRIGVGGVGDRM
jgi:hypothetical protein